MKDAFPALWAVSPGTLRRDPDPSELAGGFPCGPLDQKLENELAFRLSGVLRELITLLSKAGITPSQADHTQVWQSIMALIAAYVDPLTAKGGSQTRAFTPNVVLTDLSPNVLTVAQSIDVTGVTYLDCTAYCAFKNTSANLVNMSGRLRLTRAGATVQDADYLGCINNNSVQTPISLRSLFKGLNPAFTYTVQLLVLKADSVGPVQILDPLIFALHE